MAANRIIFPRSQVRHHHDQESALRGKIAQLLECLAEVRDQKHAAATDPLHIPRIPAPLFHPTRSLAWSNFILYDAVLRICNGESPRQIFADSGELLDLIQDVTLRWCDHFGIPWSGLHDDTRH